MNTAPATFDASHINPMSWEEFHTIVTDLTTRLDAYQKQHGFIFDAVTPLLRSGGIPGAMIANKLKIVTMVPMQLKNDYAAGTVNVKIPPVVPDGVDAGAALNILVVDCKTEKGKSAAKAAELLRSVFPKARLHFATVIKVFGGPETVAGFDSQHIGRHTDDAGKGTAEAGLRKGITIFPWETAAQELADINDGAAHFG